MTTLPENFWQEFDARLDAKLDAALNARLAPIEQKLTSIDNRLTQVVQWTKRQDTSLEYEMTTAMEQHLTESRRGFYTVRPTIFPKKLYDDFGNEITEFDGVIVLTDSIEHVNVLNGLHVGVAIPAGVKSFIVIVEAKQHLDNGKVVRKIRQHETISQLLRDVRERGAPPELRHARIDLFQTTVGLYAGGLVIDDAARASIVEFALRTPNCGLIELNGARFNINDTQNDFGKQLYGGRESKNAQNPITVRRKLYSVRR